MKKVLLITAIFFMFFGNSVFSQGVDDVPYLSPEDIAAIELVLPDDIPVDFRDPAPKVIEVVTVNEVKNEMSRVNSAHPLYHLIVLDRTYCALDSDISDVNSMSVLYKYKHGRNGFLIAIYVSGLHGPVYPQFPARSRVIIDMTSVSKNVLRDYINSTAFRKYVSNRRVLTDLLGAL